MAFQTSTSQQIVANFKIKNEAASLLKPKFATTVALPNG
jgi:hypothetical protein